MARVHLSEGRYTSVVVGEDTTARDICEMVVERRGSAPWRQDDDAVTTTAAIETRPPRELSLCEIGSGRREHALRGGGALIFLAAVVRMTPCDPEAPAVRLLRPGCFFYIHLPREDGEACPWPSPRALM